VIDGIAEAIVTALSKMSDIFNPEIIKHDELPPFMEIKLILEPRGIVFEPEFEESEI